MKLNGNLNPVPVMSLEALTEFLKSFEVFSPSSDGRKLSYMLYIPDIRDVEKLNKRACLTIGNYPPYSKSGNNNEEYARFEILGYWRSEERPKTFGFCGNQGIGKNKILLEEDQTLSQNFLFENLDVYDPFGNMTREVRVEFKRGLMNKIYTRSALLNKTILGNYYL